MAFIRELALLNVGIMMEKKGILSKLEKDSMWKIELRI
jgi:hypothetical protein